MGITGSVGRNGLNSPHEVKIVQSLLNEARLGWHIRS